MVKMILHAKCKMLTPNKDLFHAMMHDCFNERLQCIN